MSQWNRTGVVLTYITVLIADYESLAKEMAHQAEREARYRMFELKPLRGKGGMSEEEYAQAVRDSREEELSYRRDAMRFQEEANRLRGTNARRERPASVSAGLRGIPLGDLPNRPGNRETKPRVSVPGTNHRGTARSSADEDGILAHRPQVA